MTVNNQKVTRNRRRHDNSIAYCEKLDAKLPECRKVWLYGKCLETIASMLRKKRAVLVDAGEIASTMYYDLMDRKVEDLFPRGIPQVDAIWMAFLKKDAEYAFLRYYRSMWRHSTVSLDERITDNESKVTRLDMVSDDAKYSYVPQLELKMELENVCKAVSLICKRRKYKPTTCRVVESTFLGDESVADVAADFNVTANNVSAIRFRFLEALRNDGPSALAELERIPA